MSETVSYKDSSAYWRGYHEGFQAGLKESHRIIEELFMKLQNQNLPSICLEVKGDPGKVREVLKDVLQNTNQYTYLLKIREA